MGKVWGRFFNPCIKETNENCNTRGIESMNLKRQQEFNQHFELLNELAALVEYDIFSFRYTLGHVFLPIVKKLSCLCVALADAIQGALKE